ncbi:effector-associated domain 2-containing protein [Microcystis aeruginosa]|uniref:Peptidase C14, caspase catalytic subunit p20 n=1 Tax=Microcystis aeruginosa PCC 9808 TaxID=1160284 RepID=I4I5H3_MICAE|nr:caspase family protein [Microcystis aeruginosa]CCI29547.1 conserved hypothetical protein [Microcystis aeruginosa PCC 9808]
MSEPTTTKALLVGIEKYEAGENWNLNGPAHDVIRMAKWLISKKVPPENLTIFLSPLDNDNNRETIEQARELTGSEPAPATKSNIREELSRLQNKSHSLFLFYWGGHGWVTLEGKRRLFYADTQEGDERNLDFNDFLVTARSDYYRAMRQQLFIVDTCANYMPHIKNPPRDELGKKEPMFSPEQFVLFAGKLGDRAKNLDSEQTGLYTRELLTELYSLFFNETWPPNMEAISARLQRKFIDLRAQGLTEQTPTYLWSRDWSGNERNFGQMPVAPALEITTPPFTVKMPKRLSVQELSQLLNLLSEIDALKNRQRRDVIVNQLRPEISNSISRADDTITDILNIFNTSRNYSGGLKELLDFTEVFARNSIQFQALIQTITHILPEECQSITHILPEESQ